MRNIQPQFYSDRTLAHRYEVSRATIWRWVKEGKAPKPIKINGSTRWKLDDLLQWEAKQEGVV